MSSPLNDATPYGMKALRQIRVRRQPSSQVTQKINQTYHYFLEKVDPIVGECVTFLLCEQPTDIITCMINYLKEIKVGNKVVSRTIAEGEKRPRKQLKMFLATSLGPIIANVMSKIAIAQPLDVIDFILGELEVIRAADDLKVTIALSKPKPDPKEIQIAVLGLGGAGKTSLLNMLQGNFTKPKPTTGFRPSTMMLNEHTKVKFYDIGGGKKIRDIWREYFHDVHGVLYVIDGSANSAEQVQESIDVFQKTVTDFLLSNKPLLLLLNKQDLIQSIPAAKWEQLLYPSIPQPTAVTFSDSQACLPDNAGTSVSFVPDPRIEASIEWLLNTVIDNFDGLDQRVQADSLRKSQEEAKVRMEKDRKVLKLKIAEAFITSVDPTFVVENRVEQDARNLFSEEEGLTFLASEIEEELQALEPIAKEIAALVGYQKLALTIIGGLKVPVSKKKEPMGWAAILDLVSDIRRELGIQHQ